MQESAEHILTRANILVDSLWDEIINNLSHQSAKNRQIAVNTILKKLDPESNLEDNRVLQSLPIAMMASNLHIGALYFLQTCISNGAYFDPTIIGATIWEISIKRAQCITQGDNKAAEVMLKILQQLYNIILANWEYQKIPEIYLSIGADQERNNNRLTAIALYNEALWLGSIESYLHLGNAYESNFQYDMSANIFSLAYQLSGEIRFLHRLVHALCKSGNREQAYHLYTQFQKESNKPIVSFVVYLWDIHNDDDLEEFSWVITQYHMIWSFEPSYELSALAVNSSIYIANEVEKESCIIEALNSANLETWSDEDDMEYQRAISRRLYLMQTHIIILADPRYLEFYIDELQRYTISGSEQTREMMRRFFTDSFSPHVLASYQQINADAVVDTTLMELYESMRLHLVQISALFSQFSYYEFVRDVITPCIEMCMRQEWDFDEEGDQFNRETVFELKKESHEFDTYSPTTKRLYEEYIEHIDQKYGMFYRRSIQWLIRDGYALPSSMSAQYKQEFANNGGDHLWARDTVLSHMPILHEYPDIALLFLIEKIIAGQDIIDDSETIDILVSRYHLDTLIERDNLLLATMLYERWDAYDAAVEYMLNIPNILDIPQALAMLTEYVKYRDTTNPKHKNIVRSFNRLARSEYEAKSFAEQAQLISNDVLDTDDATDAERAYALMTLGHLAAIRWKDRMKIRVWFKRAGNYWLAQWYIASGDVLQELGDFDAAIQLFELAYLSQSDIVSMRRLIGCLIVATRFDETQAYIDTALREWYNISGFIFAWHLYQKNLRAAIEQMVHMIQSDGSMDMTMPEGGMELLLETIGQILSDPINTEDADHLKILASYIGISMAVDLDESDPANFIIHMDHIASVMNSYEGDDLISSLYRALCIIISDIEFDDTKPSPERVTKILHTHFSQMHKTLVKIHENNQKKRDANGTVYSFEMINEFVWRAIVILKRFPNTDTYLKTWRNGLNILPTIYHLDNSIHTAPETIQ